MQCDILHVIVVVNHLLLIEPDSPSSSPRASSVATSSEPPSSLRICLYSLKDGTSANRYSSSSVFAPIVYCYVCCFRCDENLVLFGECPVKIVAKQDITPLVDAVVDSSRYYVLKLQDRTSKKSAYIGIGFRLDYWNISSSVVCQALSLSICCIYIK